MGRSTHNEPAAAAHFVAQAAASVLEPAATPVTLEICNVYRSSSVFHDAERLEGAINEGVSGWRLCTLHSSRVRANGALAALIFGANEKSLFQFAAQPLNGNARPMGLRRGTTQEHFDLALLPLRELMATSMVLHRKGSLVRLLPI